MGPQGAPRGPRVTGVAPDDPGLPRPADRRAGRPPQGVHRSGRGHQCRRRRPAAAEVLHRGRTPCVLRGQQGASVGPMTTAPWPGAAARSGRRGNVDREGRGSGPGRRAPGGTPTTATSPVRPRRGRHEDTAAPQAHRSTGSGSPKLQGHRQHAGTATRTVMRAPTATSDAPARGALPAAVDPRLATGPKDRAATAVSTKHADHAPRTVRAAGSSAHSVRTPGRLRRHRRAAPAPRPTRAGAPRPGPAPGRPGR